MALVYPLGLADFLDQLGIYETEFDLTEALTMNEDGGGELLPSSNGPRLWEGRVTVITDTHDEADRMVARIEALRDGNGSFMVTPTTRPAPIADPGGAILGAATPIISAIGGDMRSLSVSGLPAGYILSQGDMLSFTYLTGPTRYALHRVGETVVADGSGNIAGNALWLTAPMRPGVTAGTSLKLIRPVLKARYLAGSFSRPITRRGATYGFAFGWRQTLG